MSDYRMAKAAAKRWPNGAGPGAKRHNAGLGNTRALCGARVRPAAPEAPVFDPEHPDACRRCVAVLNLAA